MFMRTKTVKDITDTQDEFKKYESFLRRRHFPVQQNHIDEFTIRIPLFAQEQKPEFSDEDGVFGLDGLTGQFMIYDVPIGLPEYDQNPTSLSSTFLTEEISNAALKLAGHAHGYKNCDSYFAQANDNDSTGGKPRSSSFPVLRIKTHPGAYVLPGFLSVQQQLIVADEVIYSCCFSPHACNFCSNCKNTYMSSSSNCKGQNEGTVTANSSEAVHSSKHYESTFGCDSFYSERIDAPAECRNGLNLVEISGRRNVGCQCTRSELGNKWINCLIDESFSEVKDKDNYDGDNSVCDLGQKKEASLNEQSTEGKKLENTSNTKKELNTASICKCAKILKTKGEFEPPVPGLRWVALGNKIYDWGERKYISHEDWGHIIGTDANNWKTGFDLPKCLYLICQKALLAVGIISPNFDAALINIYRGGDRLRGHRDDVEEAETTPLVSISLGMPCLFLLGGKSRDIKPLCFVIRTGDVLVLAGEARQALHGVPKLLYYTPKEQSFGKKLRFGKKYRDESKVKKLDSTITNPNQSRSKEHSKRVSSTKNSDDHSDPFAVLTSEITHFYDDLLDSLESLKPPETASIRNRDCQIESIRKDQLKSQCMESLHNMDNFENKIAFKIMKESGNARPIQFSCVECISFWENRLKNVANVLSKMRLNASCRKL